jgi:hypothetical protein
MFVTGHWGNQMMMMMMKTAPTVTTAVGNEAKLLTVPFAPLRLRL